MAGGELADEVAGGGAVGPVALVPDDECGAAGEVAEPALPACAAQQTGERCVGDARGARAAGLFEEAEGLGGSADASRGLCGGDATLAGVGEGLEEQVPVLGDPEDGAAVVGEPVSDELVADHGLAAACRDGDEDGLGCLRDFGGLSERLGLVRHERSGDPLVVERNLCEEGCFGRAVGLPDGGFVVALVVGLDALLLGVVERGEAEVVQDDEDGSAARGGASEPKVGAEMTGFSCVEGGEQQRRHLFVAAAGGVDGGLEGFRSV